MNKSLFERPHVLQSISEEDKIKFYHNTRQWHTKFNYQIFDLEELKSIHLEDSKKFNIIRDAITGFNREIQAAAKSKVHPSMPTKYSFYQNVVNLLREAIIAKGRDSQLQFLDRVYTWFVSNSKTSIKEAVTSEETRIIVPDEGEPLPSRYIEESLRDYKARARTMHQNCDPPQLRLKQRKRRQFNQLNQMVPALQYKSTFPKFVAPQKEENVSQDQTEGEIVINDDLLGNEEDGQEQKKIINMVPKIKVFTKDDAPLQKKEQFEMRQNYQVYQSSDNELNLQNRWLQIRQREVSDKRLDEEIVQSMNTWSRNKARIEKEIDRRIDSQYYGSRYGEIDKQRVKSFSVQDPKMVNLNPLPTIAQSQNRKADTADISYLESRVSAQKVVNARRAYRDLLNLSATENQPEEQPSSLSIYATKLRSNSLHNKFSQLLSNNSPSKINEQSLQEVIEIKNRLAKHKIPIQINSIIQGIMVPTFQEDWNNKLMDVGQQMLVDPLEEKKPKKKKKRN